MSSPLIAWLGWGLAIGLALTSVALVLALRAEHIKGKTVAALGGSGPDLPEKPYDWPEGERRVVLVGDSRIAQWVLPKPPAGYHIIKRGRGGETSVQLAGRLPDLMAALKPDIVVLGIGINDLVAASLSKTYGARIENTLLSRMTRMRRDVAQAGATPILSTIVQPARPDLLRRVLSWNNSIYASVEQINVQLLATASPDMRVFDANGHLGAKAGPLGKDFADDTLHLNPAAYARLSDALMQEITTQ